MSSRRNRFAAGQKPAGETGFWQDLNLRIESGGVVPIISNSGRNDRIFDVDYDYDLGLSTGEADPHAEALNVEEELTEAWADEIGYPLPDKHQLARVAIYNRIQWLDDEQATTEYLGFLKRCLLGIAAKDEVVADLAKDLEDQMHMLSFSEIATQLGYPRFEDKNDDPLRLLARLPLPIYVTTSYYDFMERALQSEGRQPRTQISFLYGEPSRVMPEHQTDLNIIPTPEHPLVYHLYGFEKYPGSLVLSEDDYLNFLVRVSEEKSDSQRPFIPLYLSAALTESSLILLGYRLHDWDFRILFRLIKSKHANLRKFSLAIQLDPLEQREITNCDEVRKYLEMYFKPEKFLVEWGSPDSFVKKMSQKWDQWRGRDL